MGWRTSQILLTSHTNIFYYKSYILQGDIHTAIIRLNTAYDWSGPYATTAIYVISKFSIRMVNVWVAKGMGGVNQRLFVRIWGWGGLSEPTVQIDIC